MSRFALWLRNKRIAACLARADRWERRGAYLLAASDDQRRLAEDLAKQRDHLCRLAVNA